MKLDEATKLIDAGFRKLEDRQDSTEKWLQEVEAKANTARTHGPGDGFLHAVPSEYRSKLQQMEAMGIKDPGKRLLGDLFWHFTFMAKMSMRDRTPHTTTEYYEKLDALEKAQGFDPAWKHAHVKAALGEVVGSGANIISTPVEATLYRMIRDNTIVRPLATQILMTSLTHQIPVENSNVTAYIVPETSVITDSMPVTTWAQRPLTARVFAGLATGSNQLFQDQIIGLQDYLFSSIAEHIGILEDQGALDGGTPTVQNFSGVAVAPGVNSFGVNGTGTSGGTAPTYAELVQLAFTGAHSATRKGAAFFGLPAVLKNVLGLVDSTGQPIFTFGQAQDAFTGRILGWPFYEVSSLSSAWSAATTSTNLYFGPPSRILFGDIAGMQFDIDPYSLLSTVQTRVRVLKRTAILVPIGSYWTIAKQVKYT